MPPRAAQEEQGLDAALLEKLKALRLALARRAGVPAFVVFTDATLRDMCRKRPHDTAQMRAVSGVGQAKLQRYGQDFLAEIAAYEQARGE